MQSTINTLMNCVITPQVQVVYSHKLTDILLYQYMYGTAQFKLDTRERVLSPLLDKFVRKLAKTCDSLVSCTRAL